MATNAIMGTTPEVGAVDMPDWLPGGDSGSDDAEDPYELSRSFDMDSWLSSGQATDEDLIEEEPEAPPAATGEPGPGEAAMGGTLTAGSTTSVGDRFQDSPILPILVVVAAVLVIGLLAIAGPWVDGYNVIGLDGGPGNDGTGPATGTDTETPTQTTNNTSTETTTSTSSATNTATDTSSPTSSPTATESSTPVPTESPTDTGSSTPAPTDSPTESPSESPTETESSPLPVETPGDPINSTSTPDGSGTPTLPIGDETPTLPGSETPTATPPSSPLDPILDPLPGLSLEVDDLTKPLF